MNSGLGDKFTRRSTDKAMDLRANASCPIEKELHASWIRPIDVREFVGLAFIFVVEKSDLGSPTGRLVCLTVTPAISFFSFFNLYDKWVRERERLVALILFQILTTTCVTLSTVTPILFTRSKYRLFLRRVSRNYIELQIKRRRFSSEKHKYWNIHAVDLENTKKLM